MRKYELTVLISPDLTEQEVRKIEDELISLIEDQKGLLIGLSTPNKCDLGYEIDKKYQQAYSIGLRFSLDPNLTSEFDKKLKEKKEIIRHILLLKQDKERPEKERRKKEIKPTESHLKPSKKVELGDIDKKIDEILSE